MPVREIRLLGDPILKSVCAPVVNFTEAASLVSDLLETTSLPGRAGVAANQIGVGLRAFSYNANGQLGYLINPRIVETSGEVELLEEGCLSLPGLWHKTRRYPNAVVEGQLLDGSTIRVSGNGLLAQALQHECDHLDGLIYLDRLEPDERREAMRKLRESDWFMK
ncbi:MAG: peptide deformylase [Microbacteriaceae bacterium]|nr:peptide deformylase [Microbacteriaceae bacterium]